jgi:hypothetical protein
MYLSFSTLLTGAIPSFPPMSSASVPSTSEQYRKLIQRILISKQFRSSPRLHELFNYIAGASLRDDPQAATEQQIGINVFGRKPGYNCSEDSIVRTEIRQLRLKLNAYFAEEGAQEDLRVEVPKGRYVLEFRQRVEERERDSAGFSAASDTLEELAEAVNTPTPAPARSRVAPTKVIMLSLVVICFSAVLLGTFLKNQRVADSPRSADRLWQPFLSGSNKPIVVFSNAVLAVNGYGAQKSRAYSNIKSPVDTASAQSVDVFTGVGEVAAVHALDELFISHGADFLLRRNHLLSWEEARENNVVILGSTDENTSLRDLPLMQEFTFRSLENGEMAGEFAIVNNHPRPGEKPFYTGEDHDPIIEDYAIIALLPGPTDKHWMLILGGLETYGTQAATEYATSEKGASRLMSLLGSPGKLQPFEAVLRVDVNGGVPLNPEVVAFHKP